MIVIKYSLFNISSTTELCAIMRKLWNCLQNVSQAMERYIVLVLELELPLHT